VKIYLIGSLRNPHIPEVGNYFRLNGFDVFDDWYSPGPETDDCWQGYEKLRGRNYLEALKGHHAQHAFELDKKHLDAADVAVLVLPCGKSAHLELGYIIGSGKPGFILLETPNPDRYDIMYQFATGLYAEIETLIMELKKL
jgi:nucleoside 2-deoxyribosyltransferase